MFYVYLVECADGTYYCGVSKCPEKRLVQHNAGKGAKYIRGIRIPAKLMYVTKRAWTAGIALSLEYQVKCKKKEEKLSFLKEIDNRTG